MDSVFHWIDHYPVDSMVCLVNTYQLDSAIHSFLRGEGQGRGLIKTLKYNWQFCMAKKILLYISI